MDIKKNNPNTFEEEERKLPSLPPKLRIDFVCPDCGHRWTIGIESGTSVELFYEQNKKCLSCGKSSIEIEVIPNPPIL